jgi:hypothetical protein
MGISLTVARGGASPTGRQPPQPRARPALPNGGHRGLDAALSDDPAVRRRELMAVLEICAAQARGARERGDPAQGLVLVRDSRNDDGTAAAAVRHTAGTGHELSRIATAPQSECPSAPASRTRS